MLKLRRLRNGETDYELVWLVVLAAAALCGAAWLALRLPVPRCPLESLTGLPCLTCGGTRCVRHVIAGDFVGAAGWNPLVFALVIGAALFMVYAAAVVALRLPRLRFAALSRPHANIVRAAAVLAAAANWGYVVWRLRRG